MSVLNLIVKKILFTPFIVSILCISNNVNSYQTKSSMTTASSLGTGNWELGVHLDSLLSIVTQDVIFSHVSPNLSFARGFSENFDLGISQKHGIELKYAFLNNTKDFSMAVIAGWGFGFAVFSSDGNSVYNAIYLGPILSYKLEWFEPYFFVVYNNYYSSDTFLVREQKDFHIYKQYMDVSLGFNFWVSESVALSLSGGVKFPFDEKVSLTNNRLGLGLLARF